MGGGLKEPLLQSNGDADPQPKDVKGEKRVTDFARAGLFSKVGFAWLNPFLRVGAGKSIVQDDVPLLAPPDQTGELYKRFRAVWPEVKAPNAVGWTLVKTFWLEFLVSALMGGIRLSVLFVGPILIQSFVGVASAGESYAYERYVLVFLLVAAKLVEAVAGHQYNFYCAKLGMRIKSALITTIYRKGLRLSSLSRQSHGLGPITNHMAIDVQNIADLMIQINNVWIIPVQVLLGGIAMYPVVGLSSIAGFAVMVITGGVSLWLGTSLGALIKVYMKARDFRLKALVEALASMKIIKLQAWDEKFFDIVEKARLPEYRAGRNFTYTVATGIFVIWLSPLAMAVAIFATSIFLGRGFNPSMAFTIIATVRVLQELLRLFPNTLIAFSQALTSMNRLDGFLWCEELQEDAVVKLGSGMDTAIRIDGGSFTWDVEADSRPTLENINVKIHSGLLVAVVGRVGSGKSSLLSALQGEIPKVVGMVTTSGSTACVNQTAWIQNATIRDCILFGLPMDKARYDRTCRACALLPDLAQMEFGDMTEIGEQGINLSGGQKQRIQLARALYQDSDIYFLDDIFSAVDAHTGSHLFRLIGSGYLMVLFCNLSRARQRVNSAKFSVCLLIDEMPPKGTLHGQECVLGVLKGKTVVLVTHQIEFLPQADLILVMRDGKIVQSGKYGDLLVEGSDFQALVGAHSEAMGRVTDYQAGEANLPEVPGDDLGLKPRISAEVGQLDELEDHSGENDVHGEQSGKDIGRLIETEERESGRVGFWVYWAYLTKPYRGLLVIAVMAVQTIWQLTLVAGDYWVAYEADFTSGETSKAKRFIYVYAGLAFSCAICVFFRTMLVALLGLVTAQLLFLGMLKSVFRAPMSFFETTPNGRILSRSTADQGFVDYMVPMQMGAVLSVFFQTLGILAVACQIIWQVVALVILLWITFWRYQVYYLASSRELSRMDGITKAPIISHFSETVSGISTIRCFLQQNRFAKENEDRVNSSLRMDFHTNAAAEWVGLRMELIAVLFLLGSAILLMFPPAGPINPNLIGLAFAYILSLNTTLYNTVMLACNVENRMVSVERIMQYTKLPSEAPLVIEPRPPSSWPPQGTIVLENLKLRYRPDTPLVLKGISVTINGGQNIGVVGRTGSGKSSLISALFRLVEPAEGRILIDNLDVSTIGLTDLRSRLSIIPQDPVLFDGTIRSNLDPIGEHSDAEMWEALEKCQLASNVRQLEGKLDTPVLSNGGNWSLGQRQLFCLGRVLLKHSQIVFLDEATSSVDSETDALIQKIVQQDFAYCTVISIAHRIPTVMTSDKVLVLDAGKVVDYGTPSSLLDRPKSLFSSLVNEYFSRAG